MQLKSNKNPIKIINRTMCAFQCNNFVKCINKDPCKNTLLVFQFSHKLKTLKCSILFQWK